MLRASFLSPRSWHRRLIIASSLNGALAMSGLRLAPAARGAAEAAKAAEQAELAALRRQLAAQTEENEGIMSLQTQLQAQLRVAVERADASEEKLKTARRKAAGGAADGAAALDALHGELQSREVEVAELRNRLAEAQAGWAAAERAADDASASARAATAAQLSAEARAAAADLRAERNSSGVQARVGGNALTSRPPAPHARLATPQDAAGEVDAANARRAAAEADASTLRERVRALEAELASARAAAAAAVAGGPAERRARVEQSHSAQAVLLAEQLASRERQLVAKERQLAALKSEREELRLRVERAAGPGGYQALTAAAEEEAGAALAVAEAAKARARAQRDSLASALERVAGADAVAAALRETDAGPSRTAGVSSAAERAATERADEALRAADVLRCERTELRRRIAELEALHNAALPGKLAAADAGRDSALRAAEVAERRLRAVSTDREAIRARLEAAEAALTAAAEAAAVAGGTPEPAVPTDARLASAAAAVTAVVERLRDREAVLAKVISRGVSGVVAAA